MFINSLKSCYIHKVIQSFKNILEKEGIILVLVLVLVWRFVWFWFCCGFGFAFFFFVNYLSLIIKVSSLTHIRLKNCTSEKKMYAVCQVEKGPYWQFLI